MIKRRLLIVAPFLAPLAAGAAEPPLAVVASFSILADMVRAIAGDRATATPLVGPNADVHAFQPRPNDVARIKTASVAIENGLALDAWMARLERSAGFQGRRVVASTGVTPRTFQESGRTTVDPHIWQDPRNAVIMVANIAAALAAADPARAEATRAAAAAYTAEIQAVDAEIERAIAAIPQAKRQIITSHDAFGYYGARYGVTFRAAQGINTEAEPTPKDLARLAAQIKKDKIRAIFVENMTDPRIAETLAREAGAVVGGKVYSDSLSPPDGPAATYLAMLRHNTNLFTATMARQ